MSVLQHFCGGLAAGSLLLTVFADLLPESYESLSPRTCALTVIGALMVMMSVEVLL